MMLPGQNLTRRNRLVQMLMGQEQSAPPIQSHTQGLASVLRQGLTGYMSGGDQRDQVEAQNAMIRGLTAKPWVNPDTGQVTDSPAGGYAGMQAALSGIPENEYAQLMMPQLAMADFARQQELADAQRGFQQKIQLEQMKRETGLQDKMDLLMAQEQLLRGRLSAQNEAALQRMFAQNDLTTKREINADIRRRNAERADYGLPPIGADFMMPQTALNANMPQQNPGSGQPSAVPDDFFAPNQPYMQPLPAQSQPQAGAPTLPPLTLADAKRLAAAQEEQAKVMAKAAAEKKIALPSLEAKATDLVNLIDQMAKFDEQGNPTFQHPGLSDLVGAPWAGGIPAAIPYIGSALRGTDAAGFEALLNQAKGSVFLDAFDALKGGGQITELEGQKAEQAKARMSSAQSEEEFLKATKELRDITLLGVERARKLAGMQQPANGMPPATLPPAPAQPSGGLTPDEQAELDQLRARFKK